MVISLRTPFWGYAMTKTTATTFLFFCCPRLSFVVVKKKPGIKVDTGSYCSVTDCYSVIFSVSVISIVFSMASSFPNENGRFSSGKMK